MSSEWYYAHEGESQGPISLEELRRLADRGELLRTDLVWTAPMKEWEEAGGFEEKVDRSSRVIGFPDHVAVASFAAAHTAEVEAQGRKARRLKCRGDAHDDVVVHASAELRVGMADDCCPRRTLWDSKHTLQLKSRRVEDNRLF